MFTYAAIPHGDPDSESEPESEPEDPDHPDPKEPNSASLPSTTLVYAIGLWCGVVCFHLFGTVV